MKAIHAPRAAISAWFASAQLQSATIAEQPPELDSDNHLLKCRATLLRRPKFVR
jgi:hypothetical protein